MTEVQTIAEVGNTQEATHYSSEKAFYEFWLENYEKRKQSAQQKLDDIYKVQIPMWQKEIANADTAIGYVNKALDPFNQKS